MNSRAVYRQGTSGAFDTRKVRPLEHSLSRSPLNSGEFGMTVTRGIHPCGRSPGPTKMSYQEGKTCLPEL